MEVFADNRGFVTPDGPNYVRGKVTLVVAGAAVEDTRVALCRCGASRHKPYCDNSHLQAGFRDAGTLPAAMAVPDGTDTGAPLTIEALPNGPLRCTGPLALRDHSGTSAFAAQTFLCRCGGSQRKPYCDGTHKKIGFSA